MGVRRYPRQTLTNPWDGVPRPWEKKNPPGLHRLDHGGLHRGVRRPQRVAILHAHEVADHAPGIGQAADPCRGPRTVQGGGGAARNTEGREENGVGPIRPGRQFGCNVLHFLWNTLQVPPSKICRRKMLRYRQPLPERL